MEKFLVTIEFRYHDAPKYDEEYTPFHCKTITLGVCDTRDEANKIGNDGLVKFERHFKLNPHYNTKERFSNNGGCFGRPNDLITDSAYLLTPFSFFAKITKLNYADVDETIQGVMDAVKRAYEYKKVSDN